MTKKRIEKPQREVTKRQLSQWQRQKKRQRIIFGSGAFIIIAVLGILIAGWYISQYQPLRQTVIRVNDTEYNMSYYIKMLKYYGGGQSPNYMSYLADEVVRVIEQHELIRQEAMELGISVSNEEVDDERKSRDPPLSKDYRDPVRAEMLVKKLLDEYFEQKVPVSAEHRHIMAMLLESESQVYEVRDRLQSGESFGELTSELSLEDFSKANDGDFGWRPEGVLSIMLNSPTLEVNVFSLEAGELSQPIYDEAQIKNVGYWIIRVLERKEETQEAHVQAILLGSEEEARRVRDRLEAGENFPTLAAELSQHGASKVSEGDLGWLIPDMVTPAFDEFAFDSEVELRTLSEPIRDELAITKGGYWLIRVLDIDNKKIEDENRDLLKAKLLDEWVEELWNNPQNEVESFLDDEMKAWAVGQATGS